MGEHGSMLLFNLLTLNFKQNIYMAALFTRCRFYLFFLAKKMKV